MVRIRKQVIFGPDKTPEIIHQETQVAAIVDLGDALDAYTEAFIEPMIDEKITQIKSVPWPQAQKVVPVTPGGTGAYHTRSMNYSGGQVTMIRDGNWVMWAVIEGIVGPHTSATVPEGFRPAVTASIFTGLSQGDSYRSLTVNGATAANPGQINSSGLGTGAVQFSSVWYTIDAYPT
jgi:hypothetical protein